MAGAPGGFNDFLAEKYTGKPYANEIESERVILKISPDRQVVH